jgi:hypothetical protein
MRGADAPRFTASAGGDDDDGGEHGRLGACSVLGRLTIMEPEASMHRIISIVAGVLVLALAATSPAAPPPVEVVSCGQIIPGAMVGVLTADLHCTSGNGVLLEARATLDLAGHTLSGDVTLNDGVECLGATCTVTGPGSVIGFIEGIHAEKGAINLDGAAIAALHYGIFGRRGAQVRNASFTGHLSTAVYVAKAVKIENSTFTNNSRAASSGGTIKLIGSTITGGSTGLYARGANLIDSTIDTTTDGGTGPDIQTNGRPRLRDSTCAGTSSSFSLVSWGVCALD